MLSRLMAEESLLARARVAAGSGVLKPEDSRSIVDQWMRLADAPGGERKTTKAKPADLEVMGIRVIVEKKEPGT
jgi:hypothetical protein